MAIAFGLLLVALVSVLYHDRDFWFPDSQEAEDETLQSGPTTTSAENSTPQKSTAQTARKRTATAKPHLTASAEPEMSAPPFVATATRTVLPPLEVEVVAGDTRRKLQPGSNAVNVEVDPDPPETAAETPPSIAEQPAADVTDKAAERVEMSPDTSAMVSASVKPDYPMLARQMKVQGSVILMAMIGRDGLIQDLRVLSGPPILSGAAREAVKQWHFKPHYEGQNTVETVARITVNFTISTN